MFYEILDKKRMRILPLLKEFKKNFYLAGGTALALQLGHRDSIDFDFFSESEFSTKELFKKLKTVFKNFLLVKVQEEENTISVIIDESIKLSFFYYPYKQVKKFKSEEVFRLASIEDIACMKLSAIVSRAVQKDYVDLYFILKQINLEGIFKALKKKMPELDENLILKSLVYFKDVEREKIIFKKGNHVSFEEVKNFLRKTVKKYQSV